MRLRAAEMSPSFFFLCDFKLRVGSEEMENKRLAAVVTGERPNLNELLIPWWPPITDFVYYSIRTLNNLMNQILKKSMFRRSRRTAMAWLAALAAQAPAGSVRDKPNEAGGAVAVNI